MMGGGKAVNAESSPLKRQRRLRKILLRIADLNRKLTIGEVKGQIAF